MAEPLATPFDRAQPNTSEPPETVELARGRNGNRRPAPQSGPRRNPPVPLLFVDEKAAAAEPLLVVKIPESAAWRDRVSPVSFANSLQPEDDGEQQPAARLQLVVGQTEPAEVAPVEPPAELAPVETPAEVVPVEPPQPSADDGPTMELPAVPESAPDATLTIGPVETKPAVPDAEPPAVPVFSQDPRPIGDLTTNVSATGDSFPENAAGAQYPSIEEALQEIDADRGWAGFGYLWEASATCHRPLYFEEINAERYGYSCCRPLQPAISGARFFATVPALPYKMTVEPRCECVYPLGHYRPGSCAPYRCHRPPLKPKAGLVEAGVVTGLILAVP